MFAKGDWRKEDTEFQKSNLFVIFKKSWKEKRK
jgi:hypothetical protein